MVAVGIVVLQQKAKENGQLVKGKQQKISRKRLINIIERERKRELLKRKEILVLKRNISQRDYHNITFPEKLKVVYPLDQPNEMLATTNSSTR